MERKLVCYMELWFLVSKPFTKSNLLPAIFQALANS